MIDYYKDCNPVGKIYNSLLGSCHDFFSLTSLLNLIDEISIPLYDEIERCFIEDVETNTVWDENTYPFEFNLKESRGHLATFKIDILFTQRKSWQGVIRWIEKDSELCFRSVFELIKLIDNVGCNSRKVTQRCNNKEIFDI